MGREVELRTVNLVLRSFRSGDVDDSRAYRDDSEFARFLRHIPQPFTQQHAEEFVAVNMTEPWETLPTFAVVLDGHVIGTVNFKIDPAKRVAMIGYAIARAHWGRGLATEAATAALRWAVAEHDLVEIWASTDADNVRSRRVLEKLGMTLDPDAAGEVTYRVRRVSFQQ
jgi:ribosomal-protein-alanine N-acetyltransferase